MTDTFPHFDRASRGVGRLPINASRLKPAMERAAAAAGLAVLSPFLLLVAAAIRLDSPGPVLFRQARHGRDGEIFHIYKFRTMTAAASREGFRQATRGDARVTRIGRILRTTSIDELPQLLNVALGDMALVGPRPHPLELDRQFQAEIADYMLRYRVRPGITGLAQVSGHRGPTPTTESMARRVALDLEYIEGWSLATDFRILIRTAIQTLAARNGS